MNYEIQFFPGMNNYIISFIILP